MRIEDRRRRELHHDSLSLRVRTPYHAIAIVLFVGLWEVKVGVARGRVMTMTRMKQIKDRFDFDAKDLGVYFYCA